MQPTDHTDARVERLRTMLLAALLLADELQLHVVGIHIDSACHALPGDYQPTLRLDDTAEMPPAA